MKQKTRKPTSSPAPLPHENSLGLSGPQLKAAWIKGQTLAALSLAQQASAEPRLTPSEIQSLRQKARANSAYFRKVFAREKTNEN